MSRERHSLGEFELIERYFSRDAGAARPDVVLGIGDDAALLRLPQDAELVAAVDTVVAGRHFPFDCDARSIGHRSLAVNLSDLAAMGATPAWATLALTLPAADPGWLQSFSEGFMQLADEYGVVLVGGDTTAGPLTVSVQILGHVPRGTALLRSGGQPGDVLAVTGTLGDAGAGLALVTSELTGVDRAVAAELIDRFEYPRARVAFGWLARGVASAAMDLSDGLVGDLPKLAAASGLGAEVDVDKLPLSAALRAAVAPARARTLALGGILLDQTSSGISTSSLPYVQGAFALSPDQGSWFLTLFNAAYWSAILASVWGITRMGRKRFFVRSCIAVAVLSFACALTQEPWLLFTLRIAQGFALGGIFVNCAMIIFTAHRPAELPRAFIGFSTVSLAGSTLGPLIGGSLNEFSGWVAAFFWEAALAAVIAVIAFQTLPEDRTGRRIRHDFVGLTISVIAIAAFQFCINDGERRDWFDDPEVRVAVEGCGR